MRNLIVSLLFVAVTAIVGLGWTLDRLFDQFAGDAISDELQVYQALGSQLATLLDALPDPASAIQAWVSDPHLSATVQSRKDFPLPSSIEPDFNAGKPLVLESDDGVTLHYYLPSHGEVLSIAPAAYNPTSLSSVKLVFTLVFYIGILALLLVWLYPLIIRLTRLRHAAKEFGRGQLDFRINTQGVSYISDIELEFNRMAERIQTLVSDNKLLSSAVSHDLRTPLARLRFGIDTLEDTRDPQSQLKYVQRLSNDIAEMEKLVVSLLDFARLDHVLAGKQREEVVLDRLVPECIELHRHDIITIALHMESGLVISGHADYFAMLLNNLLHNALKFARQVITVNLEQSAQGLTLQVSDDGPGIPSSEHRNVLIPFTRSDVTAHDKGYGLGLAIVNRIAQWHGGSVNIDSDPGLHGARISVTFPMNGSTSRR